MGRCRVEDRLADVRNRMIEFGQSVLAHHGHERFLQQIVRLEIEWSSYGGVSAK
jgi:hypothetical protein